MASRRPCAADGVFTQSLFAGPSVALCRRHLRDGTARAVVTVPKLQCGQRAPGRQRTRPSWWPWWPGRVVRHPTRCWWAPRALSVGVTRSTDLVPISVTADAGQRGFLRCRPGHYAHRHRSETGQRPGRQATVTGIAKGSGMIEPDMATLLAYVFTDAAVPRRRWPGCSGLWWTPRSTPFPSTRTRRPRTPPYCWPTVPPVRSRWTNSSGRCTACANR